MKILFFARRFYPDIGGVEKHVFELSKRLIALGHNVTVVSEGKKDASIKNFEKQTNIRVYKINTKNKANNKLIIWRWLLKNKQLIHNADIIHCHDVFYWYLPFRFLYPSKPVYTTFHGYESFPIRKNAIAVRKISEILSWGNICIGDFIKKWYGTKPSFVSYGAVDVESHKVIKLSSASRESAVFMGRLDEQTGILTYVKAFEILKKKYPKFEFTVIGDGKYKKQIVKKVKTLGFKKDPEKYFKKYYFAFVSRYLSILEAFAAKKLVFAVYDNPVKEDYLRMAPFAKFIIIVNKPEKLVQHIEKFLYNSKSEQRLITSAYEWVKKQSWEELVSTYLKLWRKKN